jgi:hypothetical protein
MKGVLSEFIKVFYNYALPVRTRSFIELCKNTIAKRIALIDPNIKFSTSICFKIFKFNVTPAKNILDIEIFAFQDVEYRSLSQLNLQGLPLCVS